MVQGRHLANEGGAVGNDRAALTEARQIVQAAAQAGINDSLALLVRLSDLRERRCTRSARAELWEMRGLIAREMGWQDGAQRALAEAASLRKERTP